MTTVAPLAVAVLEDLEQVVPLPLLEMAEAEVVEDEQVGLGHLEELAGVGALRPRDAQLLEEAGHATVEDAQALPARHLCYRARWMTAAQAVWVMASASRT